MGLLEAQSYFCHHPENMTCSKRFQSIAANIMLYVAFMTGILLATFGNLVVIISISHFKQLHTPTNVLTLSLAATDFLIGIFIMPVRTVRTMNACWYFGDIICMAEVFCYPTLTTISVCHLIFLAIDRYFSVCYPLLYTTKITINISFVFIAICWLVPVFYMVLFMFFYFDLIFSTGDHCLELCATITFFTLVTVDMFLTFMLPCSVMLGLYCKIFIVAMQHARAIQVEKRKLDFVGKEHNKQSEKSQNKATRTIGIVIFTFILCLFPFYVCQLLQGFIDYSILIKEIFEYIALFNFAFNPIIYGLFYPWFRKAFRMMVTWLRIYLSIRLSKKKSSISLFDFAQYCIY
uniref:G-protein coupled receptors family 1 profile domain-containing protein n=1 Tax=Erpetoichthys calabaricus TaxID=27687 RepID=A0A8C4RGT9_ERPCA